MPRHVAIGAAVVAASVGAALLACDPGWSVAGAITLGAGVDPVHYSKLRIHAGPRDTPDAGMDGVIDQEYTLDGGQVVKDGELAAFPIPYQMSRLGVQAGPAIRVTAALVVDPVGTAPVAGDALGTADGTLEACAFFGGAYCGPAVLPDVQLFLIQ